MRICGSFFLILQAKYEYIITHIRLFVWVAYLCNWHCIIYMRIVGKGNPFDAYNHELAPRTKHLMTDGPYKFTRNPMLVGIYIYDIGVLFWLQSGWPLLVFAAEIVLLTLQVHSEEKRLEKDFGADYRAYKESVPRYLLK